MNKSEMHDAMMHSGTCPYSGAGTAGPQVHDAARAGRSAVTPSASAMVKMYTGRPSPDRPPITREKLMAHLSTITHHKMLVLEGCWKVGLYRQGLLHDLSKYSPTEFLVGARYFQGNRSPNNAEREDIGYSSSWLHHKGRNRHHFEYWVDYNLRMKDGESPLIPVKMPGRYVVEMLMDRIAASKIYQGDAYTDKAPLHYYGGGRASQFMHPETAELLESLLRMLAEKGEDYTFAYVRSRLSKDTPLQVLTRFRKRTSSRRKAQETGR